MVNSFKFLCFEHMLIYFTRFEILHSQPATVTIPPNFTVRVRYGMWDSLWQLTL
jgi:hypothetical protein